MKIILFLAASLLMAGCTDKPDTTPEPPVVVEPTPTVTPSPEPTVTPTPKPPVTMTAAFDCSSFTAASNSSALCAVDTSGWQPNKNAFMIPSSSARFAAVEGGKLYMSQGNGGHLGTNLVYQKQVNVKAFEATFTFIPSGKNIALVIQNSSKNSWGQYGPTFTSGAGCEAGFFQGYGDDPAVDKIFALALMQDMPLKEVKTPADDVFTHSSAMIYKSGESPCSFFPKPKWANVTPFSIPTKISTSPVALNSPANKILTSTGDNYEAKISYDGSNVTLDLKNLTKGGASFTHTWKNVNIPDLVGDDKAYVSISAGCNSDCPRRVNVNSFKFAAP